MRFARKFARSFSKAFSRGFAGSSGGIFDILKRYYQYVFTGKSNEIVEHNGGYAYENYGIGGEPVRLPILNTQIATFDGTAYLQGELGNFAGLTITTFIGTSTPTIDYVNDRINFTAGTAEYLEFNNGTRIYFQESNGVDIYTVGDLPSNNQFPYTLPFNLS